MLTAETNERLARVGPGTPGGELLRRYWLPLRPYAKLLSEPVMKVRLLGEDLVLFRTLKGEIGLIGDRCAHRSMGLQWGIPGSTAPTGDAWTRRWRRETAPSRAVSS